MPNPTTERLAREAEAAEQQRLAAYAAAGVEQARVFASALSGLDTVVSLGPDAEELRSLAGASDPVCAGCQLGFHDDPASSGMSCSCCCHAVHQRRGTGRC